MRTASLALDLAIQLILEMYLAEWATIRGQSHQMTRNMRTQRSSLSLLQVGPPSRSVASLETERVSVSEIWNLGVL